MKKTLGVIFLMTVVAIPIQAEAYGSRNWLQANQSFNRELQHHRNERGVNLMEGARRTTVRNEDDMIGYEFEGNLRNNNSTAIYHWEKELKRRY